MLKEFNPDLATRCEDLYAKMVDDIITSLLNIFPYRAIPEGNPECEDYVEYLGKLLYTGGKTLKDIPSINYEAGQFSRKAVAGLNPEQRFLAECYFADTQSRMPTDEDIHVSIMENLDAVLYEIGQKVEEE